MGPHFIVSDRIPTAILKDGMGRVISREVCGARTYDVDHFSDGLSHTGSDPYVCNKFPGHTDHHHGWNEAGYTCDWLDEASMLDQLYEPVRWETVLETEYTMGDVSFRYELSLIHPPQYEPEFSWEEWE